MNYVRGLQSNSQTNTGRTAFSEWNPIHLTKSISKLVGEVKTVKVLRNGSLLIICLDGNQQAEIIKVNKIDGERVQCITSARRTLLRKCIDSSDDGGAKGKTLQEQML